MKRSPRLLNALRMAFNYFTTRSPLDPRISAFRQFVVNGGQSLQLQATFDTLQAYLKRQGKTMPTGYSGRPAIMMFTARRLSRFAMNTPMRSGFIAGCNGWLMNSWRSASRTASSLVCLSACIAI